MLRISEINYSVEGRPLFVEASAVIPEGHKVGVVGHNGAGKTTLFRIIRGELGLDGGEIILPSRAKIGGIAQEVPSNETSLIDTVLEADVERHALMQESETAKDPGRIAEIQSRLADIDAWSAEGRAASILKGLGFDDHDQQQPCSAYSGGWRMRVALAGVLFAQPDVLLLDEPTNYLDLEGALWLENYLAKYPHTVIIISHDRGLLNRAVGGVMVTIFSIAFMRDCACFALDALALKRSTKACICALAACCFFEAAVSCARFSARILANWS